MDKKIYFDNAATTKVRQEVIDEMIPYYGEIYGNPSSVYELGREARKALDNARESVAKNLGAESSEIYFTSGGTESNNWAIKGIAESLKSKGNHIITSQIEHHAVLYSCEYLEQNGYEVTYLPVDEYGLINLEELQKAIRPETILITVMYANNEIGTIQPINEIGKIAKENNILFHTDAVQVIGDQKINLKESNIDLLSLSAHKFNGPKGVGVLYIKKGTKIKKYLHGGAQESNRRGSTENIPGIVGLAKALELLTLEMLEENKSKRNLRDRLIKEVLEKIPNSRLNGSIEKRLNNNVNISFDFIEGEGLLLLLDMHGIYASSGSACTSGSLDPSHVLLAIGLPHEKAHGSLRVSFGKYSTEEEVDKILEVLPSIVERLRSMSPLYEDYLNEKIK